MNILRYCSHIKSQVPSSFWLTTPSNLQDRSLDSAFSFLFFFSFFLFFFLNFLNYFYWGKTPHNIDRSIKNWQKAIITKHGNKNIKILCTDIPANEIIRIMVIGVLDLTGWRNLIHQKKTLFLHSHSLLSFSKNMKSWFRLYLEIDRKFKKKATLSNGSWYRPLHHIEQNVFLFEPSTYSKQYRKDGFPIWSPQ